MSLKRYLLPGLKAARANFVPALLLQAVALVLGLAYWLLPPVHELFSRIAEAKEQGGYLYSMVSTSLWGGVLPLLLVRLQKGRKVESIKHLPFFILYWACVGLMVDAFYRFQSWMFGDAVTLRTLVTKVSFDMWVFTPLVALPLAVSAYAWKDSGFRFAALRALWRRGFYPERVLPLCPANWAVWIPAVSIMYALPLSLQLPMQNLVQCLWVLFLMILTKPPEQARSDLAPPLEMRAEDLTAIAPAAACGCN